MKSLPLITLVLSTLGLAAVIPDRKISPLLSIDNSSLETDLIERTVIPPASINAKFVDDGKLYIGTATDQGKLSNPDEAAIIHADFGAVTPEYSMKWDYIHPSRYTYNWATADSLVDWARANGQRYIRGHCLVWWQHLPAYVSAITDKATMKTIIEEHITAVVGRYKGMIYAWDVVNEPFLADGSWNTTFPPYAVLGPDYVKIAFQAARRADPAAKLYLNTYNLDGENWPILESVVKLVPQWRNDHGVPIDGIGSQAHLDASSVVTMPSALEKVCKIVPECAVTELDIKGANPQQYVQAVYACKNIENCVGVTVWGVSDAGSWESGTTPLLFDGSYEPKDAYYALRDSL